MNHIKAVFNVSKLMNIGLNRNYLILLNNSPKNHLKSSFNCRRFHETSRLLMCDVDHSLASGQKKTKVPRRAIITLVKDGSHERMSYGEALRIARETHSILVQMEGTDEFHLAASTDTDLKVNSSEETKIITKRKLLKTKSRITCNDFRIKLENVKNWLRKGYCNVDIYVADASVSEADKFISIARQELKENDVNISLTPAKDGQIIQLRTKKKVGTKL